MTTSETSSASLAELSAADARHRERRTRWWTPAVLVVAALIAGLLLWRDLRDDRPYAVVGSFTAARSDIGADFRRTVLVPGAGYDVAVSVEDDVTRDAEVHARQAPDGGRFVGVGISRSPRQGPSVPDTDGREPPGARFVLIVDGRRYGLPTETATSGLPRGVAAPTRVAVTGWLAVAGEAESLRLETSWQGRVQRLDLRSGDREPGDFAALYRQRSVGEVVAATTSCGTATWTAGWRAGPGVPAACAYRTDRLAWSKQLGWAKTGRQWLALTVTTSSPSYPIRRVGTRDIPYGDTGFGTSSAEAREPEESPDRLDGAAPLALWSVGSDASRADTTVLVFDVARTATRHTAVVTVQPTLRARVATSSGAYDPEFAVTWTVSIGG